MRFLLVPAAILLCAAPALTATMATVMQKGRAFNIPALQVTRGDTVHFVNDDTFLHQIYIDAPSFGFESDEQEPGQTVDLRFTQQGTFTVLCHIHPKMTLRVDAR